RKVTGICKGVAPHDPLRKFRFNHPPFQTPMASRNATPVNVRARCVNGALTIRYLIHQWWVDTSCIAGSYPGLHCRLATAAV
ncbi:hypothetical protein, partial [Mucilaginibacter sp. 5C4]|uniref:hypothetical protein n=1 Tax=Mucilaginibacter sp. 5C4 TaxID=3048589 RepID=UPI002B23245B